MGRLCDTPRSVALGFKSRLVHLRYTAKALFLGLAPLFKRREHDLEHDLPKFDENRCEAGMLNPTSTTVYVRVLYLLLVWNMRGKMKVSTWGRDGRREYACDQWCSARFVVKAAETVIYLCYQVYIQIDIYVFRCLVSFFLVLRLYLIYEY